MIKSAKIVQVIETVSDHGDKYILEYWTVDGRLISTHESAKEGAGNEPDIAN